MRVGFKVLNQQGSGPLVDATPVTISTRLPRGGVRRSSRPVATKAQVDCEELLIYIYGSLTKRLERVPKLRNGVALVLEASWAYKMNYLQGPTVWALQAFSPSALAMGGL